MNRIKFSRLEFGQRIYIVESFLNDFANADQMLAAYNNGLLRDCIKIENNTDINALRHAYDYVLGNNITYIY